MHVMLSFADTAAMLWYLIQFVVGWIWMDEVLITMVCAFFV